MAKRGATKDRRVAQHKEDDLKEMSAAERREVLEGIARDTDAYPRDRIQAVRALMELDRMESEDGEQTPATGVQALYEVKPRLVRTKKAS